MTNAYAALHLPPALRGLITAGIRTAQIQCYAPAFLTGWIWRTSPCYSPQTGNIWLKAWRSADQLCFSLPRCDLSQ